MCGTVVSKFDLMWSSTGMGSGDVLSVLFNGRVMFWPVSLSRATVSLGSTISCGVFGTDSSFREK